MRIGLFQSRLKKKSTKKLVFETSKPSSRRDEILWTHLSGEKGRVYDAIEFHWRVGAGGMGLLVAVGIRLTKR